MAMITEARDVRDFDEIVVQGRGDLILEQGDVESVVIEADETVMPRVKAAVEGRRLVLGLEHWWDHLLYPVAPLRFRVSAVTVNRVTISGSGTVRAEALRSEDLRLEISGSGEMVFPQLIASAVSLGISGGGKMTVSGEAGSVAVRISGSGNVQTGELATQAAEVRISGSGNVRVNAAQTLDVQISGSGSVKYAGQPQISQRISGSGSVVHTTAGADMETDDLSAGRGGRGRRGSRTPVSPEPPSPSPNASSTEQMAILKMVEDGRITPEEADALLKALGT
jgi:Putative auto-transporter adhesin, head GIN domain/SHOCT-like domain